MNNATIMDLFIKIKDLLIDGRFDVVANVAKKPDLHPKLKEAFNSIADLIQQKNSQIESAAQINRFYRQSIDKISRRQPIDEKILTNNFPDINESHIESIVKLQQRIKEYSREVDKMAQRSRIRQDLEEKISILQSENQLMTEQISILIQERQKNTRQTGKAHELERQIQNYQWKIKQLKEQYELKEIQMSERLAESQEATKFVQIQLLKKNSKLDEVLEQLKKTKHDAEISTSVTFQTQKLSSILKEKEEQNEMLKEKLSNDNLYLKSFKSSDSQCSILPTTHNQYALPTSLTNALQDAVGQIQKVKLLYSFANNRKQNFHESIDKKNNILLLCLTVDDQLIGAFTSACFSLNSESMKSKAFLFGVEGGRMSVNRLKRGKQNFIIFGNDELCIERGKNELTSQSHNTPQKFRHYENPKNQDFLQRMLGYKGQVLLKNYEIYQIDFS